MPKIRIKGRRRSVRIRLRREPTPAPQIKRHAPITLRNKDTRKPTLFIIGDNDEEVETVVLDAKKRKEVAAEKLQQERDARRRAHTEEIRLEMLTPVKVPKKPKATVTVTSGKIQPPKDKDAILDFGWLPKKDYLAMPAIEDAVKVAVYSKGVFIENLYLRVTNVRKDGQIVCVVSDEVFWPKQHGIDRGDIVRCYQAHVTRLVQHAKWVDGKYYETQTKEKPSETSVEKPITNADLDSGEPEEIGGSILEKAFDPAPPVANGELQSVDPKEPPNPIVPKNVRKVPTRAVPLSKRAGGKARGTAKPATKASAVAEQPNLRGGKPEKPQPRHKRVADKPNNRRSVRLPKANASRSKTPPKRPTGKVGESPSRPPRSNPVLAPKPATRPKATPGRRAAKANPAHPRNHRK